MKSNHVVIIVYVYCNCNWSIMTLIYINIKVLWKHCSTEKKKHFITITELKTCKRNRIAKGTKHYIFSTFILILFLLRFYFKPVTVKSHWNKYLFGHKLQKFWNCHWILDAIFCSILKKVMGNKTIIHKGERFVSAQVFLFKLPTMCIHWFDVISAVFNVDGDASIDFIHWFPHTQTLSMLFIPLVFILHFL